MAPTPTATFKAPHRSGIHRALAVTLAAALCLLLLLGMLFAIAKGSQQITGEASGLHDADETLRAATVVRAQLGLAVHMVSVDATVGTSSGESIDHSLSEARLALSDLQTGLMEMNQEGLLDEDLENRMTRFSRVSIEVIDLVDDRQAPAAHELGREVDEAFQDVVNSLEVIRADLALSVENSDQLLGHIGDVARFLVAFLVPAGVIFIYRELIKRQQRQADLERRLEMERSIGKTREEFIANASHELRTPLTGILGLAHMLAEDPLVYESDTARELLNLIILESGDLARMVDDLLTAARLDADALHFTFEDVEVSRLVADVVEPVIRTEQLINSHCDKGMVRTDELRLRQVLRNLLSNARKYGGPLIEVEGFVEGRTYVCVVRDNGPGIPDQISEQLFQRFVHQGSGVGSAMKGSVGLGLSIVHALTQGMGGTVSYHRSEDWTEFRIRLPLSKERAVRTHPDHRVSLPHDQLTELGPVAFPRLKA